MRTRNVLFLSLFVACASAIQPASSLAGKEGSGGVRGGSGTEIDLISQLPREIQYRADYRWPASLIPAYRFADGSLARELQVRKTFTRSEVGYPHQGIRIEFFGRPVRGQGEWTRLPQVGPLTRFAILRMYQAKEISDWEAQTLQREAKPDSDVFYAAGGKMFTVEFDMKEKGDNAREQLRLGAGLQKYSALPDKETISQRLDRYYLHRNAPELVSVWIDGAESSREELEEMHARITRYAEGLVQLQRIDSLVPLAFWAGISRDLALENPVSPTLLEPLMRGYEEQAKVFVLRVYQTVSPDGACDLRKLDEVVKEFDRWQRSQEAYFAEIGRTGIMSYYRGRHRQDTSDLLMTPAALIRAYCLDAADSPESDLARARMLEQIEQAKTQLNLGDLLKE